MRTLQRQSTDVCRRACAKGPGTAIHADDTTREIQDHSGIIINVRVVRALRLTDDDLGVSAERRKLSELRKPIAPELVDTATMKVPHLRLTANVDAFSPRPREQWTPDTELGDGPAYALLDLSVTTDRIARDRIRLSGSVHNALNSKYSHLVYQDDANKVNTDGSPRYPEDIQGEERLFLVEIETEF